MRTRAEGDALLAVAGNVEAFRIRENRFIAVCRAEHQEGAVIRLEVDGVPGTWVKMDDGKDGRPTPGIRPVGSYRDQWHKLQERRGDIVSLVKI